MQESPKRIDLEERHFERLLSPYQPDGSFFVAVKSSLATASIIGAARRLGLTVQAKDSQIEIQNPGEHGSRPNSAVVDGYMADLTPTYAALFFERRIPAPSPLAIQINNMSIYTTNAVDPENSLLGIEINLEDGTFSATMQPNNTTSIKVAYGDSDDDISLSRSLSIDYFEDQPYQLDVSQHLGVKDPVLQKSRVLWERIERTRTLDRLGAPRVLIDHTQSSIRDGVVDLSNLLGADFEGEEITALVGVVTAITPDEIFRRIFDRAGKQERIAEVLRMFREGIYSQKAHGLIAHFSIKDYQLSLDSVENTGRTTFFVPRWRKILQQFREDAILMLADFEEVVTVLHNDFENLAAIVNEKLNPQRPSD